jgi:hypothetical protein
MSNDTRARDAGRRTVWAAGLIVAGGAGIATAHGLYQVAAAAQVPPAIGWLYPLITDGLALVAYAATARLYHRGRRYAASIVVLAAGLSGLAQAIYLAGGLDHPGSAPAELRFGVGAWPAIAAALTAHLLHLIAAGATAEPATSPDRDASNQLYNPQPSDKPNDLVVQPGERQARTSPPVQPARGRRLYEPAGRSNDDDPPIAGGSARERALNAASRHHAQHGALPTVTELMRLANVARGTAGTVLKDLRAERPGLHIVNANPENRTDQ